MELFWRLEVQGRPGQGRRWATTPNEDRYLVRLKALDALKRRVAGRQPPPQTIEELEIALLRTESPNS
ncbi:hypothetical protein TNCV_2915541 [Trichonephila clavipes]|nr:hypothetical protein TNCV_2915541 [Trichonephila clavipes]